MTRPRFEAPEGICFECSRCGDCCRGWNVMLGPGEPERLEALDWRGRADDLTALPVIGTESGRPVLARRGDGACVYLGADDQCRIHQEFGSDAKPLLCRMFPFGFLPVGDRIAVDVSFACRSVSEGIGPPIGARAREWEALVGSVRDDGEHRFSKKYAVEGELLWELEHAVLQVASLDSLTMIERIRGLSELIRLAFTADPRTEAAAELRRVMIAGIPKLVRESRVRATVLDKTQRAVFFHFLFLHLNPTPPELSKASGKPRVKEVKRRVQAADGFKFEQARPWVDNRDIEASYRDVAAVEPGYFLDREGERLFARYLAAKIVGQRFMREGENELPFVEAVPRLLLTFPMTVWTAKALAAVDDATAVSEGHVRRALKLIDRSYGEVSLSDLPAKQKKAWSFVLLETDLAATATSEMLVTADEPAGES